MDQTDIDERIHAVLSEFQLLSPFSAGYPVNQDFDYSALYPLLGFSCNNVGDPFAYSRYQSNTHETEREVVRAMAELARLPPTTPGATSPPAAPRATCTASTWAASCSATPSPTSRRTPTTPSARSCTSSTSAT